MKNYDTFFETPGSTQEKQCRVCGALCKVERDRSGPTSWAAAMGKIETEYDYFICPNINRPWHEQALELVKAIEATPSKRVAELMKEDLMDLLREQGLSL